MIKVTVTAKKSGTVFATRTMDANDKMTWAYIASYATSRLFKVELEQA